MRCELFNHWLKTHPCSTDELWKVQNCLGTLFGFTHECAQAAENAWQKSRLPKEKCCDHDTYNNYHLKDGQSPLCIPLCVCPCHKPQEKCSEDPKGHFHPEGQKCPYFNEDCPKCRPTDDVKHNGIFEDCTLCQKYHESLKMSPAEKGIKGRGSQSCEGKSPACLPNAKYCECTFVGCLCRKEGGTCYKKECVAPTGDYVTRAEIDEKITDAKVKVKQIMWEEECEWRKELLNLIACHCQCRVDTSMVIEDIRKRFL